MMFWKANRKSRSVFRIGIVGFDAPIYDKPVREAVAQASRARKCTIEAIWMPVINGHDVNASIVSRDNLMAARNHHREEVISLRNIVGEHNVRAAFKEALLRIIDRTG